MKILQTLGKHAGTTEGIFAYKRVKDGIYIDVTIGNVQGVAAPVWLTHAEWSEILKTIHAQRKSPFRLTGKRPFAKPPKQSLYAAISAAVPNPAGGWNWHDSLKAAVCAILEHEGSVDFYHGVLGQSTQIVVCVKADA
ncbi:MAG: hypothetical protein J0I01_09195 [Stenotrophomonas nitritireducens]|uniref:hypothetical protein n=1 Tax=Stenotrophomonas nitritireducens TaxID=83617 RepID=UPI001AD49CFF|nr:hypothetical protein [Stenotrophomonas nitritireducens]MBN8792388.1 hypothetical protein [Stenotrophomonas nitritireducens]MBN8797705.1 hypothetical protein [Stenotrophomonas nitritireducens]